jgi:hypothetical protein
MLQETTEIQELSLEKVIDTKLVQNNVTQQVLAALKERYGSMKLKSLDDKEGYLDIKQAAKDCAKVRNLATKVCKEGREDAVRQQKLWIAKEKEVVNEVLAIEKPLDDEISRFDAEVERRANEEKKRQEEAYINRQAQLTKMGATYEGGSFVLGEVSFEAELVKGASQDIWEEAVVPKFREEYEKREAVRIAQEKKRADEEAEMRRQQAELQRQQEELRQQQLELQRKREEDNKAMIKARCTQLEAIGMSFSFKYNAYVFEDVNVDNASEICLLGKEDWDALVEKIKPVIEDRKREATKRAEDQRKSEIEAAQAEAARLERERIEKENRLAEEKRLQEEARRAEELAQASDKEKFADLVAKIEVIQLPEMRSGQYRKKVAIIREKIGEILSL